MLEYLSGLRSGIEWQADGSFQDPETSTVSLENADKWIQFILDHPTDTDPGTLFKYTDGASVLLGKIVGVATGQRLDKWTEQHLFDPIGINEYFWKTTPDGEMDSMGGLFLSAHDLARIGLLVLRDGMCLSSSLTDGTCAVTTGRLNKPCTQKFYPRQCADNYDGSALDHESVAASR